MKYLVDSDYIAEYLKGREQTVTFPEGMAISLINYAEVYEGIYYGYNPTHYTMIFRRFLAGVTVLSFNRSLLQQFARIRGELRRTGKIIGDFDILIAATAIQHHLTLVTGNLKDFARIPGLKLYQTP
jgi:tRNA(fMet)-specific endonuclease VapC